MTELAALSPDPAEEYEALLQFLYLAPVGLAQIATDGEIVMINPLCARLLMPLSRDGNLANLFTALQTLAPDLAYRARTFEPLHGKVCDAMPLQIDSGMPGHKDPQVLSLTLLKLDSERLMAVLDDVSLSVKRDRELRHSQAWIHTVSSGIINVDYALMSLDCQGLVQGWNAGIRHVTGFEADATVGCSYANFYPDGDLHGYRVLERLREADLTGWNLEEGWLRRAGGERFWGSCLIVPLRARNEAANEERAYSLIIRDISDRREAHEALRRSVWCDHLTGLANRRAFFDAAAIAMQRCAKAGLPLSVAVFDADHFKSVNDNHGHAAGDAVLRHLAAGLSATFRTTDIVARFGGEEFVVLLPGSPGDEAQAIAQRLCMHVAAKPVNVDGASIHYTVSAGVAGMTDDIGSLDELIKRADTAMYSAKARGRNRVERWHAELAPFATSPRIRKPA
ncbi:MAG: diguanylate cyclase [Variovorax sp.]|nr:diguanylate cyclase [Variovorax sp.]